MSRIVHIVLFAAILALPGLQTLLRVLPESSLHGASAPPPAPVWSLRNWWSGELQRAATAWLDANIGLRGAAVRTDNQIGYSVFRESWSKAVDRPVVGRKGTVFEKAYLDVHNGRHRTPDSTLAQRVETLAVLQRELRRRGIVLLIAVSPSKVSIYPEWVAPGQLLPPGERTRTNGERMLPLLRERGIPTVDGRQLFLELRRRQSHELFPPQGIHWNRYGASLFVDAAWAALGSELQRAVPRLELRTIRSVREANARDAELDVAGMLNVWRLKPPEIPHVRAEFTTRPAPDQFRPRVVIVGDSFADLMYDIIRRQELAETVVHYFYFKRRLSPPARVSEPFDPAALDWAREIWSAHAVILEVNEGQLEQVGFAFLDEALPRLTGTPL